MYLLLGRPRIAVLGALSRFRDLRRSPPVLVRAMGCGSLRTSRKFYASYGVGKDRSPLIPHPRLGLVGVYFLFVWMS